MVDPVVDLLPVPSGLMLPFPVPTEDVTVWVSIAKLAITVQSAVIADVV